MTAAELADRDAIHDVLRRYARGVDAQDLGLVAACFTSDAAYDGALGRGTVADALVALADAFTRYAATMHVMGNQTIAVAGDVAHSETDCVASHVVRPTAGGGHLTVGVHYADDLARTPTGWRITRRRVVTRWQRREETSP